MCSAKAPCGGVLGGEAEERLKGRCPKNESSLRNVELSTEPGYTEVQEDQGWKEATGFDNQDVIGRPGESSSGRVGCELGVHVERERRLHLPNLANKKREMEQELKCKVGSLNLFLRMGEN